MPVPTALTPLLEKLAPPGLAWSAGAIGDRPASSYPEEEAVIRGACVARRREFRAGRFHARRALARLGVPCQAIPRLPCRAPGWPCRHVGSIAHSPALCIAVAAERRHLAAVGIDIEPLAAIPPRIAAAILGPQERLEQSDQGLLRTFTAKEAVFKACAAAETRPEFRDIALRWDSDSAGFVARVRGGIRPIFGAMGIAEGHLVALAWSEGT